MNVSSDFNLGIYDSHAAWLYSRVPENDNRWLTLPNLLSLSRIALIPVWWWAMQTGHELWGALLIIYAIISDVVDGWIARHWNQASRWGRILDPIGDKLAALVVGLFCVLYRELPVAALALTIARDLSLVIGGWVILRRTQKPPVSLNLGRYAALIWGIVLLLYAFDWQPYARYTVWPAVGLYLIAGLYYLRHTVHSEAR
jgi:cardiolipin synthase